MQVFVKGSTQPVNLNKKDFVASGGEGEIYAKRGTAYKIYLDPKRMIPPQKMHELAAITDTNVIRPQHMLLNKRNKPIGYTMRHIPNTYALCQIFTKAFRNRNNLSNDIMLKLVQKMQKTIQHIHDKDILLVDGNEMNFLVNDKFSELFFIDIDSYQTSGYPATAIMESIRDRHSKTFSTGTDWFSFGVVSFQMFVGIHPYKGKHPSIKTMDDRMKANIPVFHKQVTYPKVCQPFDIIPGAYKDWFKALFFDGKRLPPPSDAQAIITVFTTSQAIQSTGDFDIIELGQYGEIIDHSCVHGIQVLIDKENIYIPQLGNSLPKVKTKAQDGENYISVTPKLNKIISATIKDNMVRLVDVTTQEEVNCLISAEKMMCYDGRLFVKNKDTVSEITFVEVMKDLQAVPHIVCNVLENATKIFDGVVIQNILGTFVASVFPEEKTCYQITIPEFKNYSIIDAKYVSKVLMVVGSKNGEYDKFIVKFADDFKDYSIRKVENITYTGLNFVVLYTGIVVHINEEESLEMFSNHINSDKVKIIDSEDISGDMKLHQSGEQVLFSQGDKLYRLKMKN